MKDKRPVNLDISTIRLPLPAYASILHRISGVILFIGTGILLWLLDRSLASPEGFAEAAASPLAKFLLWGVLVALGYHTLAGVRHLLMDVDIGESKAAGVLSARIVIIAGIVLALLTGVWVW